MPIKATETLPSITGIIRKEINLPVFERNEILLIPIAKNKLRSMFIVVEPKANKKLLLKASMPSLFLENKLTFMPNKLGKEGSK